MADEPELDLSRPRRIHVVAVGGSGMGPIAEVLAAMGHAVSGSDQRDPPNRDRLEAAGVTVHAGHDAAHVCDAEVLAVSTAVGADNPEVAEARRRGIPVLRRTTVLGAIARTRRTIAVSGTHGKTTTSALLATVLDAAGLEPSFVIGADVGGLGGSARWTDGAWFVVEADESDGTFLAFEPEIAVVTNVEPDHLEHWGGFDALTEAFGRFLRAGNARVVCIDDPIARDLAAGMPETLTYGLDEAADVIVRDVVTAARTTSFELADSEGALRVELAAPGAHNACNAAAAFAAARAAGVSRGVAAAGLARFEGVARRFEVRGEAGGVTFVDSYDHLPSEVAAVLRAAKSGGWRRVVCVFQPHRYSRIGALWRDFADAFVDADRLAITDIYPAGETPRPGVDGTLVVHAVLDAHPWADVAYLPRLDDVVTWLRHALRPGDLCLTLGAGDLTEVPDRVLPLLGGTP